MTERWDWQAIAERAAARFSGSVVAAQYAEVFQRVMRGRQPT